MGRQKKLFSTILGALSDANIGFEPLCSLLRHLGFEETVRGSHHLFRHPQVIERLNVQAYRLDGEAVSSATGSRDPDTLRSSPARGGLMEPRRYELSVWWSADDRIFVVEVPELPGCGRIAPHR